MQDRWQTDFIHQHGIFQHLAALLPPLPDNWPSLEWLQQTFYPHNQHRQQQYRLISQDEFMSEPEVYYEQRIFERCEIPTRLNNWHDFFGAVIWWLFPETKQLLNEQHMQDIATHGAKKRTPRRDRITHFDECGIVVATSDIEVLEALTQHKWIQAWVNMRQLWSEQAQAYVFGHAIYELALNPYIGFTGKMYPVLVDECFFHLSLEAQYKWLDQRLAQQICDENPFAAKGQLTPLPVMGVPYWFAENENSDFYLNQNYFCPLKNKQKSLAPTVQREINSEATFK